ncbi:MAG: glutamate 5-kinase [Planctomycetota bacterium]
MSESERKSLARRARLAVVKVGTNVLAPSARCIDPERIRNLADQIARLHQEGVSIILVTSGAIASGVAELGLSRRPDTLPDLQAAAAVGQSRLMRLYGEALKPHGLHAGQVLLSRADFADRSRYLNIRHALAALLRCDAVPIINENDSTSTEEITFGENDLLSALVANLVQAPLLVILTTAEGLERDVDGRTQCVDLVPCIDDAVRSLVRADRSASGAGGMATKLEAAAITTAAGEACIIADGRRPDVLLRIWNAEKVGTLFLPAKGRRLSSRKRWLASAHVPAGSVTVDAGAKRALVEGGKSLLASGVLAVQGEFVRGDLVIVQDEEGTQIARGLINYDSRDVGKIRGLKTREIEGALGSKPYDEVIHRDHLVLTEDRRR